MIISSVVVDKVIWKCVFKIHLSLPQKKSLSNWQGRTQRDCSANKPCKTKTNEYTMVSQLYTFKIASVFFLIIFPH